MVFVTTVQAAQLQAAANPIRKVVTMLQAMSKKVEAEGEKEKELYDKFMCYCSTGGGDLSASIQAAEEKVPAVGSSIEASEGKLTQSKEDLKSAQTGRADAKKAVAEATAIREKEAAAFADFKADADTNIAAMAKAVTVISKGMGGSFLQTSAAGVLRKFAQSNSDVIEDSDKQELLSFLSGSSEYAPASGEIVGILKQMHETMSKARDDAVATEGAAVKSHESLVSAKSKEIAAQSAMVEAKTKQIGELGVAIVQMKEDLSDTQAALEADKKFLAELETSCKTKTAEWEERSKTRAEELVALADTIKVLNDDDALELFKKTLPGASASLLEVQASGAAQRREALAVLRSAQKLANAGDKPGLEFLALALSGKSSSAGAAGFDKVIKMIDDMVALLGKEQADDDDKKEYCAKQFDFSDDKVKALKRSIAGDEATIATAKESIATLTEEMAALEAGIIALDKAVAEATKQRRDENTEYKALIASNSAAKDVLAFAKNRLNKFYNPKLYKAPPKVELSAGDRIYSNEGGVLTTAAPGGIAGTGIAASFAQVSLHRQKAAPAPPPQTWGAYATKSEENTGVIAMIDLLIKDLDKEMTEAETDEKNSQADYETMMKDSAAKRTSDSKALSQKGSAKADTEAALQDTSSHLADETKELMATEKYIASLHAECDWLLQYFDARKEARAGEVDSLQRAKAVLSGADYSFLQTRRHSFLGRSM